MGSRPSEQGWALDLDIGNIASNIPHEIPHGTSRLVTIVIDVLTVPNADDDLLYLLVRVLR
jgi:hypothetical protein